jgi:hypothetical protein
MRLALLPLLIAVSGCAATVSQKPIFPPRAEIERLQEAKPAPTIEIVTDEVKRELYNAELESWGERLSAAGRRLCRWMNDNGAAFDCAPPPGGPK